VWTQCRNVSESYLELNSGSARQNSDPDRDTFKSGYITAEITLAVGSLHYVQLVGQLWAL